MVKPPLPKLPFPRLSLLILPWLVSSYLKMVVWPIPYNELGPPEYEYNCSLNPRNSPTSPARSETKFIIDPTPEKKLPSGDWSEGIYSWVVE